ncbi:hypothetical protein EV356DRAFT_497649 [Viridothelium virens]|uniref:Glycoside hydrolase family 76 protein n=1 Tax=Viridothelium virens TaxID=1048519 RepID=A0A6A6HH31_VIRVR|nr:hypothetical protein EV356DRAFT_497649 [Viridothelium virens]
MVFPKLIWALVASTLASSVYAVNREVYMGPVPKPIEDTPSNSGVNTTDPQAIKVADTLYNLEALFALENLAIADRIYAAKAKNYMETAFSNAQNLRDVKNTNSDRYKDPGWWALLWTAAYDLTNDEKYVEEAERLLDSMVGRSGKFCGQGSRCSKTHTYIKTSLSELALSLAQVTHRMSSGSWFSLDWATRRYDNVAPQKAKTQNSDDQIHNSQTGNTDEKNELKERGTEDCLHGNTPASEANNTNVVGGIIELCLANSTKLDDVHTLAGAFMANITERVGPNEPEFSTAGGYEPQFQKVFVEQREKLLRILPNEKYQHLLDRDLNRVSEQGSADAYGSLSWVGPCFPLNSHAEDWICWALVLR